MQSKPTQDDVMPSLLNAEEINAALAELNQRCGHDWQITAEGLVTELRFDGFESVMAYMQVAAKQASELDHHPHWCNVYNRLKIELVTHSAGGVTELDFQLAGLFSEIANKQRF